MSNIPLARAQLLAARELLTSALGMLTRDRKPRRKPRKKRTLPVVRRKSK